MVQLNKQTESKLKQIKQRGRGVHTIFSMTTSYPSFFCSVLYAALHYFLLRDQMEDLEKRTEIGDSRIIF